MSRVAAFVGDEAGPALSVPKAPDLHIETTALGAPPAPDQRGCEDDPCRGEHHDNDEDQRG